AAHHPDKHPAADKRRAEARSAAINHAYRTLADPLLRAQYLLSLRGVDVAADETLKVDEPGLLAAVLDAHEAIEEAAAPHHLRPLRDENEARIRRSEGALERAFREDDVDAAKREAVRLRYWVNIRESVRDWEEGRPVVLRH
ncbi:J-type co-chaperone JAC1, mitochondrial, partial [Tolypocladium capitatum]